MMNVERQAAHARAQAQIAALQTVAKSIREYADGIYADVYGDTRQYEHTSRIKEHFEQLAEHLDDSAREIQRDAHDVATMSKALLR